ncbi:helix-turn-helix domain-containing protein, partial [Agrilactobacillus composti]|uniref:helix-turn-helix domain-containing protein n=2 Tax=Agrilactobacillus composti TaxID=398555 RepID=UPI0005584BDB
MPRKRKYDLETMLWAIAEIEKGRTITSVSQELDIARSAVRIWRNTYLAGGEEALRPSHKNKHYSAEFKIEVVTYYLEHDINVSACALKFGIKSSHTLSDWIFQYNEGNKLKVTGQRGAQMTGKKSQKAKSFKYDEKINIVEWLLKHDSDYLGAVREFKASYQQVYSWLKKYRESGPDSLKDRRGRKVPEEELTEVQRLKIENRLLKARLEDNEIREALAKKVREIERR